MYKFNDISENNNDDQNSTDDDLNHENSNDDYSSDDERQNNKRKNRDDDYSSSDEEKNRNKNKNKNNRKRRRFNDFSNPLLRIILSPPPPFLKRKNNSKSNIPPKEEEEKLEERNDDEYFETNDILYPIDMKINNLSDLIKLGQLYKENEVKKYVINLKILNRCVPSLIELQNMIGMKSIKERIVDLFFFYLQNFTKGENNNMLHTIIEGTPGSGKNRSCKNIS